MLKTAILRIHLLQFGQEMGVAGAGFFPVELDPEIFFGRYLAKKSTDKS